uniref:Protochlorophyllide reductase n=1 Tax=Rhodosorus marinus TaxID=101924 RepID=A0A7S3EJZ9_9RHOD|mmetsp:Transcript_42376/g.165454  ORF Transcript_42376/g.165454 Transcript_42376/m.165454 type:complete len:299 (+) Transcript_42376:438-1334(+)|eukprot:CAMPEP_0113964414 /NCGR_PEP_ID=MMETSP0011_2-20120614/7125_1 /TAXON_ID=101924 /ORGANISM="Rhodosorus marinus" /LENGTH=298 /DNA_ID=CAMNT_0000976711 /DNA_START=281 /DNA_END=1180 /DNA_ORIENTATION=- /assembly_acc=CAM_ASM_000156
MGFDLNKIPDQTGKVAIVTGSNIGVGFATAKYLVLNNAHVIIASRTEKKGLDAVAELVKMKPDAKVEFMQLDLASLDSVRAFVNAFIEKGLPLHILVNNAGIAGVPHSKTADGCEISLATNHLGTYLLTTMLLDTLKKSAPARVVTVSSLLANGAKADFDDVGGKRYETSDMGVYAVTKLYNIMFAQELDKRVRGEGVRSFVVQPGIVKSDLFRKTETTAFTTLSKAMKFLMQTPDQGSISSLYAATSDEVIPIGASKMFGPNYMNIGNSAARKIGAKDVNDINNKLLWEKTQELVSA